jgi:hypothetical protein
VISRGFSDFRAASGPIPDTPIIPELIKSSHRQDTFASNHRGPTPIFAGVFTRQLTAFKGFENGFWSKYKGLVKYHASLAQLWLTLKGGVAKWLPI